MEYFSKDDVLNLLSRNSITKKITLADGVSIYDSVKNLPTADVVPKSEVDKLENSLRLHIRLGEELEEELASTYDKLEETKQEVAREIFEGIDRIVLEYCDRFIPPAEMVAMLFDLKKKYAESEGEE